MDFPLEIAFGYVGHLCLFVTVVFTVIISYIGLASYLLCVQNVLTIIWFTIFMLVLQRQHYYFIIVTIGSIRTTYLISFGKALFPSICICVMKQSIVMEASNMINEIRRDHLYIIENVSNKMRRRMPKGQDEKQRNLTQSSSSPCCCYICINVSYVGSDFWGNVWSVSRLLCFT